MRCGAPFDLVGHLVQTRCFYDGAPKAVNLRDKKNTVVGKFRVNFHEIGNVCALARVYSVEGARTGRNQPRIHQHPPKTAKAVNFFPEAREMSRRKCLPGNELQKTPTFVGRQKFTTPWQFW
jgi:hypothetical protein